MTPLIRATCPIVLHGVQSTNVPCNGGTDGTVTVSASGGVDPLQYSVNGSVFTTSPTFTGYSAGTYALNVTVTDGVCTSTTESFNVTITQPASPLTISTTSTSVTLCYGNTNGSIEITATGGTPGYQYSINNGSTWVPTLTTSEMTWTFTGLGGGTYPIAVRDANLCITDTVVTLTQPSQIIIGVTSTNVSCNNLNNGTIAITASGGTGTLLYSIDGGISYYASNMFAGLSAGNYTVQVQDANSLRRNLYW